MDARQQLRQDVLDAVGEALNNGVDPGETIFIVGRAVNEALPEPPDPGPVETPEPVEPPQEPA